MVRIAIDAMGGDYAPEEIVKGGIQAAQVADGAYEIVFVGPEETIAHEIAKHGSPLENVRVVHAPEVIPMDEKSPATAIRKYKQASIVVAMGLQKQGQVDAVIGAGNTGAAMAASLIGLGRLKGVSRPAITSPLPTQKGGITAIIDAGANVDCKPANLVEFGLMGSIYYEAVFGVKNPRVALLSNGEESSKGNEATLEAHQLLKDAAHINFIGNVEGRDIMRGVAEVVVCDGFVGNIVLKFSESMFATLHLAMEQQLAKEEGHDLDVLQKAMRRIEQVFDYEEYGGAPLLGINGTTIIAHGSSTAKAIRNAVKVAYRSVKNEVNRHIQEYIQELQLD
ncbi:MAG: phosphate acyltransferase PlsX [Gemmatimonadetes bacterium]|nr:MAG: phosphate acyltransferase PlsX [Gemmatimonadota bacterium]